MAHVIQNLQKPALIIAPNKTLAGQLFFEFKELFPSNSVEYFVSYYDYYQPEAYIPSTDTYIEKDSSINDQIDRLRHSATTALLERSDVIIISSVSCIYGLGGPEMYRDLKINLKWNQKFTRDNLIKSLVEIQYQRQDFDFHRATFRVRGAVVEVFPPYEENCILRIEFFNNSIHSIAHVDSLSGRVLQELDEVSIYPVSHYVSTEEKNRLAIQSIGEELKTHLKLLTKQKKIQEKTRLKKRTLYDLEMIEEMGTCPGIENYSRHFNGRKPGEPPPTLLDYFPSDYLLFIDESHISVPQIGGMYRGDRSRKETLVEHGFRLPSALDNRPLNFQEFEKLTPQTLYVSATPGDYEIQKSKNCIVEQIVRPTGLLDPEVLVRPAKNQVQDLLKEIKKREKKNERVLVSALTKKSAENLSSYYQDQGVRVKYLHSDIKTIERMELLKDLRLGVFQVLVGINLLREGLDLPEVSLVAILSADKEGFLRSHRSLIQTIGRSARHIKGQAILYAQTLTKSIQSALSETQKRRKRQMAFNQRWKIKPRAIQKSAPKGLLEIISQDSSPQSTPKNIPRAVVKLKKDMKKAANELDFEKAVKLRDQIKRLQLMELNLKDTTSFDNLHKN